MIVFAFQLEIVRFHSTTTLSDIFIISVDKTKSLKGVEPVSLAVWFMLHLSIERKKATHKIENSSRIYDFKIWIASPKNSIRRIVSNGVFVEFVLCSVCELARNKFSYIFWNGAYLMLAWLMFEFGFKSLSWKLLPLGH